MGHSAEVIRDQWGIPHLRAGSVLDVVYGQGRSDAATRGWQIELNHWRAEGRVAERVGLPGLDWDRFARRLGVEGFARRCFAGLSEETRRLLTAYVAGVNDGWANADVPEFTALGVEPEPWRPWTPIGVFAVEHVLFGTFPTKLWRARLADRLGAEALALLRTDGPDPAPTIVEGVELPPVPVPVADLAAVLAQLPAGWLRAAPAELPAYGAAGSNALGVGGARTATGRPLVGGDSHRIHDLPNVYQQIHLACPEFDVVGFAFPGVPGIAHFAHTGTVAWGITNATADYQDLYVERLDSADVEVRRDSIPVRDAEPVELDLLVTGNGPVIVPLTGDLGLSLRTPALVRGELGFEALLPLLRARTVDDVEAAFRHWVEPVNNVVAADSSGELRYWTAGRVPVRRAVNQWLPVPGWGDYGWQHSTIPYERLPRRRVPAEGQVVTANQRISADRAVAAEYAKPARAARIRALLGERVGLTAEDVGAVSADVLLEPARRIQAALAGLADLGEPQRRLAELITAWDRRMAVDSAGAAAYAAFRSALVRRLAAEPILAPLAERATPALFDRWVSLPVRITAGLDTLLELGEERPLGLDVPALCRAALGDVLADPVIQPWGLRHRYAPVHGLQRLGLLGRYPQLAAALDVGAVPLAGDSQCVLANHSVPGVTDLSGTGPVARYVWDLANRDHSRWVVPHGCSGVPGSPHFTDQLKVWAAGGSLPVISDWDRLADQHRGEPLVSVEGRDRLRQ